jgi:hypothetical protein
MNDDTHLPHVDIDILDGTTVRFTAYHPSELGINPSNWNEHGCGKYDRIYVRQENNGEFNANDANFAMTVTNNNLIWLCEANFPSQWSVMRNELNRLVKHYGICPLYFGREAISSGNNSVRTAELLGRSTTFGPLINAMYAQESVHTTRLWLLGNHSGIHEWHRDKFPMEGYRCLITMGTNNKVMFFRNNITGAQFGVGLFHGSHVSLSAFGAGVRGSASNGGDSPVWHCVITVDNEQSWLIGNEYNFSF